MTRVLELQGWYLGSNLMRASSNLMLMRAFLATQDAQILVA